MQCSDRYGGAQPLIPGLRSSGRERALSEGGDGCVYDEIAPSRVSDAAISLVFLSQVAKFTHKRARLRLKLTKQQLSNYIVVIWATYMLSEYRLIVGVMFCNAECHRLH